MLYNNLKKFVKKFPILWKFLVWFKDRLIDLFRLKDVLMMMILFHVWPEQTYRFSTRRLLPCKKNRFCKESKRIIPYDLLKSKSSNIPTMKEINLVGRGSSFDMNDLKEINGPIFLISVYCPLSIDGNGKVILKHNFSYETMEERDSEELFNDQTNKEFKKKNITYTNAKKNIIEMFKKNGNKVLSVYPYATDKDGNHHPTSMGKGETSSYRNLFDHDQCRRITVAEMVYRPPLLSPYPNWPPTGSFIVNLCALSYFAKKINVYGWDFYLDSSPEYMSYWQLFFNMYKYKLDLFRSRNHFESALINFYYAYQISKLPNINIHGYLGQLGKHEKLIKRIERVLFN